MTEESGKRSRRADGQSRVPAHRDVAAVQGGQGPAMPVLSSQATAAESDRLLPALFPHLRMLTVADNDRAFPLMGLLLIPIGIALDFVIGSLAKALNLPIFLDSVGTVLAAVLGGPVVGGITGLLGVLSLSAFAPAAVVWSLQAAAIGVVTGLLARFGLFRGVKRIVISTLVIIVLSVALSATISYLVFGGFDGYGIGVIRAALVESGMSLPASIVITSTVVELIDKSISVALPMVVIGLMSDRFLNKFSNGPRLRDLQGRGDVSASDTDVHTTDDPTVQDPAVQPAPGTRQSQPAEYGSYDSHDDTEKG